MKATVSPASLGSALGLVSRAVSPRSTLPVLGNVLLETVDTGLRVTATNLDLTIAVTLPATVLEEGRTTVPARLLSEYISSLGEALCTMELEPAAGETVKLTVTHTMDREGSTFIAAVSSGWPQILSNLKSLLETGATILPPKRST